MNFNLEKLSEFLMPIHGELSALALAISCALPISKIKLKNLLNRIYKALRIGG